MGELEDYQEKEFTGLNAYQMYVIRLGLDADLDVSINAKPEYNANQMHQILWGLEDGLDVFLYANPKFNDEQMQQIRWGLKQGLDVSVYASPEYDWEQMEEIRRGLDSGLDVSVYAKPEYTWEQMRDVREKIRTEKEEKYFFLMITECLCIGISNCIGIPIVSVIALIALIITLIEICYGLFAREIKSSVLRIFTSLSFGAIAIVAVAGVIHVLFPQLIRH